VFGCETAFDADYTRGHDASEDFQVEYPSIKVGLVGISLGNKGVREGNFSSLKLLSRNLMVESIKWGLIVDILITKESRIEEAENQHIWE
jgi:hypothetical protein